MSCPVKSVPLSADIKWHELHVLLGRVAGAVGNGKQLGPACAAMRSHGVCQKHEVARARTGQHRDACGQRSGVACAE